eukprot:TRINITY_DN9441_c0_g1_i1.p1 TRINITY_DN9441_c0_g1~~TRINITY_DN9441_c0_g1_i1.p1  ORF type:complete len:1801 (-),score=271.16 TRINITY_DN9441_c0_g1_i1:200-5602(-)
MSDVVQDSTSSLYVFLFDAVQLKDGSLSKRVLENCRFHFYVGDTAHSASQVFSLTERGSVVRVGFCPFLVGDVGEEQASVKVTIASAGGDHLGVHFGNLRSLGANGRFSTELARNVVELRHARGVLASILLFSAAQQRWTIGAKPKRAPGECVFAAESDAQANFIKKHIFGNRAKNANSGGSGTNEAASKSPGNDSSSAQPNKSNSDSAKTRESTSDSTKEIVRSQRELHTVAARESSTLAKAHDKSADIQSAKKSSESPSKIVPNESAKISERKAPPASSASSEAAEVSEGVSVEDAEISSSQEEGEEEGEEEDEDAESDEGEDEEDEDEGAESEAKSRVSEEAVAEEPAGVEQKLSTVMANDSTVSGDVLADSASEALPSTTAVTKTAVASAATTSSSGAMAESRFVVDEASVARTADSAPSARSGVEVDSGGSGDGTISTDAASGVCAAGSATRDTGETVSSVQCGGIVHGKGVATLAPENHERNVGNSVETSSGKILGGDGTVPQNAPSTTAVATRSAQLSSGQETQRSSGHTKRVAQAVQAVIPNSTMTRDSVSSNRPKEVPVDAHDTVTSFVTTRESSDKQNSSKAPSSTRDAPRELTEREMERERQLIACARGDSIENGRAASQVHQPQKWPSQSLAPTGRGTSAQATRPPSGSGTETRLRAAWQTYLGGDKDGWSHVTAVTHESADNGDGEKPVVLSAGFRGQSTAHRRESLKAQMLEAHQERGSKPKASVSEITNETPRAKPSAGDKCSQASAPTTWVAAPGRERCFRVAAKSVSVRIRPDVDAPHVSGIDLRCGDLFRAVGCVLGEDSFAYLELMFGRGYVFNDSRVVPVRVVNDESPPSSPLTRSGADANAASQPELEEQLVPVRDSKCGKACSGATGGAPSGSIIQEETTRVSAEIGARKSDLSDSREDRMARAQISVPHTTTKVQGKSPTRASHDKQQRQAEAVWQPSRGSSSRSPFDTSSVAVLSRSRSPERQNGNNVEALSVTSERRTCQPQQPQQQSQRNDRAVFEGWRRELGSPFVSPRPDGKTPLEELGERQRMQATLLKVALRSKQASEGRAIDPHVQLGSSGSRSGGVNECNSGGGQPYCGGHDGASSPLVPRLQMTPPWWEATADREGHGGSSPSNMPPEATMSVGLRSSGDHWQPISDRSSVTTRSPAERVMCEGFSSVPRLPQRTRGGDSPMSARDRPVRARNGRDDEVSSCATIDRGSLSVGAGFVASGGCGLNSGVGGSPMSARDRLIRASSYRDDEASASSVGTFERTAPFVGLGAANHGGYGLASGYSSPLPTREGLTRASSTRDEEAFAHPESIFENSVLLAGEGVATCSDYGFGQGRPAVATSPRPSPSQPPPTRLVSSRRGSDDGQSGGCGNGYVVRTGTPMRAQDSVFAGDVRDPPCVGGLSPSPCGGHGDWHSRGGHCIDLSSGLASVNGDGFIGVASSGGCGPYGIGDTGPCSARGVSPCGGHGGQRSRGGPRSDIASGHASVDGDGFMAVASLGGCAPCGVGDTGPCRARGVSPCGGHGGQRSRGGPRSDIASGHASVDGDGFVGVGSLDRRGQHVGICGGRCSTRAESPCVGNDPWRSHGCPRNDFANAHASVDQDCYSGIASSAHLSDSFLATLRGQTGTPAPRRAGVGAASAPVPGPSQSPPQASFFAEKARSPRSPAPTQPVTPPRRQPPSAPGAWQSSMASPLGANAAAAAVGSQFSPRPDTSEARGFTGDSCFAGELPNRSLGINQLERIRGGGSFYGDTAMDGGRLGYEARARSSENNGSAGGSDGKTLWRFDDILLRG